METLAFLDRELAVDETLVRVITAHFGPHANALAIITQGAGLHLVASRAIRGEREMRDELTNIDDTLLDRVIRTLVESFHDGGLETSTAEGADAGLAALSALARDMAPAIM